MNMRQTDDTFEVFDGGHCYLRAKLVGGKVEILRWPRLASLEEVAALGAWAKARGDAAMERC